MPLETAELAAQVSAAIEALRGVTIPQAASDLTVALSLAATARAGAVENVRANLPSISDTEWLKQTEEQLRELAS